MVSLNLLLLSDVFEETAFMFKRFAFLLPIAMAACQSAPVQPERAANQPGVPLQLTVRTDRQTYRISDNLRLETQLLNTGEEDIYIWNWDLCWNFARGLSIYLIAPNGSAAHGDFLFDCVPPPPRKGDVYEFFKTGVRQFPRAHRYLQNLGPREQARRV
jgi:hypothetical protein